jgi:hypothetical protein
MGYLLGGIGLLGFSLWEIRRGEADLLFWLGNVGIDITRGGNPILFWTTIGGQVFISIANVAWGTFVLTR